MCSSSNRALLFAVVYFSFCIGYLVKYFPSLTERLIFLCIGLSGILFGLVVKEKKELK